MSALAMFLKVLLIFSFGVDLAFGGHSSDQSPILIDPPSYDMESILFKEGRPKVGDEINSSLTDAEKGTRSLEAAIIYLSDNRYLRVQIKGFSDKMECQGVECDALAGRRALLVFKWLESRGVPLAQLCGYSGFGKAEPLDFSATEKQKQNNRRVVLQASREICNRQSPVR